MRHDGRIPRMSQNREVGFAYGDFPMETRSSEKPVEAYSLRAAVFDAATSSLSDASPCFRHHASTCSMSAVATPWRRASGATHMSYTKPKGTGLSIEVAGPTIV